MFSSLDYTSDAAKWKAYQYQDPYAEGIFVVAYKNANKFCTPNCDLKDPVQDKSLVSFYNSSIEAIENGYVACSHCNPTEVNHARKKLVMMCLEHINQSINFNPPSSLFDENNGSANSLGNDGSPTSTNSNNNTSSQNNHLVTIIACRHIAYAAAASYLNNSEDSSSASSPSSPISPTSTVQTSSNSNNNSKKRRKRGGVVGFKELAAKSKLSPWHFHRVFKSITGLTPKAYGDKCSAFVKNFKEQNVDSLAFSNMKVDAATAAASAPVANTMSAAIPALDSSDNADFTHNNKLIIDNNANYVMTPHRHSIVTTATSQSFDSQILDNPNSFSPNDFENNHISPISSYLGNGNTQFFTSPQDNSNSHYRNSSRLGSDLVDLELFDLIKAPLAPMQNSVSSATSNSFSAQQPSLNNDASSGSTLLSSNNSPETQNSLLNQSVTEANVLNAGLPAKDSMNFNVNPDNLDFNLYLSDFTDNGALAANDLNLSNELSELTNDALFSNLINGTAAPQDINGSNSDTINYAAGAPANSSLNNDLFDAMPGAANAMSSTAVGDAGMSNDFVFI